MKRMTKIFLFYVLFVMVSLLLSTNCLVLAKDTSVSPALPLESFEITGGLTKEVESTFDKARTITGTAEKGTILTIRTYRHEEDEVTELHFYEITIGPSGMFTQIVELALGENMIEITAVNDERVAVKTAVIKRKDKEIKRELEQSPVFIIP